MLSPRAFSVRMWDKGCRAAKRWHPQTSGKFSKLGPPPPPPPPPFFFFFFLGGGGGGVLIIRCCATWDPISERNLENYSSREPKGTKNSCSRAALFPSRDATMIEGSEIFPSDRRSSTGQACCTKNDCLRTPNAEHCLPPPET